MKVKRAVGCVSMMPKRLNQDALTRKEALALWAFIDAEDRLPISRRMMKVQIAKEIGVYIEQFDAVIGDVSIAQALVWESPLDNKNEITLNQIVSLFNHIDDADWVLSLCSQLDVEEAEFIWRWALKERWLSIRNRMRKWVLNLLGASTSKLTTSRLIEILYDKDILEEVEELTIKLEPWIDAHEKDIDRWWFIPDATSLRMITPNQNGWTIRKRTGEIDSMMTKENDDSLITDDAESLWVWETEQGTKTWGFIEGMESTPSKSYLHPSAPQTTEWEEATLKLKQYTRAAILIQSNGKYYLLTDGSVKFVAQALRLQKQKSGVYIMELGLLDGDEIVKVLDIPIGEMQDIPFTLHTSFKKCNVNMFGTGWRDIPTGLFISFSLIWNPTYGWYPKFKNVESEVGTNDVSQLLDYKMMMKGLDNHE